ADPARRRRLLEWLAANVTTWAASDAAPEIADAAWSVSARDDGLPRRDAILVATAPGSQAGILEPALMLALRGPSSVDWLETLAEDGIRDGAARILEPDASYFAGLLVFDEVADDAARLLAAMRDPPAEVRDQLFRAAASPQGPLEPAAPHAASVVASWAETDATCAAAVHDLLTTASPATRAAILDAWIGDVRPRTNELLEFAPLLTHANGDVRDKMAELAEATFDRFGDLGFGATLRSALERADGDAAIAICRLAEIWGRTTIDYDTDRYPGDELAANFVRLAADRRPTVAVAALRALDTASWDVRATAASIARDRLDDPVPEVRAWALYYAAHAEEPDEARIAAAARAVLDVVTATREIDAAFSALRWSDPRAAFDLSRRWVDSGDETLEELAADAARDSGAPSQTAAAALLAKLRSGRIERAELRALLASPETRPAVLDWLESAFRNERIESKAALLEDVVGTDDRGPDLVAAIERLRAIPEHRADADVALAALGADDADALRRLDAALGAGGDLGIADWRILDLGAGGAALFVRHYDPLDTIDGGAYVLGREPEAVASAVARQASDPDPTRRSRAARWTSVLPEDAALATLRRLVADDDVSETAIESAIDRKDLSAAGRREVSLWATRLVRDTTEAFVAARAIDFLADASPLPDGATDVLRSTMQRSSGVAGHAAALVLAIHGSSDAQVVAAVAAAIEVADEDAFPGCD
ncbi:MAG: hypothetical protein IT185_11965, partial [Acidobacteria bacterium]|nr:hypothetical protein [Acidobacteriota bacterium]